MSHTPEHAQNFQTERTLSAQRLAQYVQRNRCERYMRFVLFPSEARSLAERFRVPFEALSPLLSGAGQTFEREIVEELGARERVRDLRNTSAAAFVLALREQTAGRTIYYQPRLEGTIGGWACEGYADLVQVERDGEAVALTIIDIKASRRETVGFRLQVAFYARLLLDAVQQAGLRVTSIDGAVFSRASTSDVTAPRDSEQSPDAHVSIDNSEASDLAIDTDARESKADDTDARAQGIDPDRFTKFDLALYLDEIAQLVAAADSDVARAARVDLESAAFHLGAHCDGCPYNSVCFIHAAEREDISLIPTLTSNEKIALRVEGFTHLRTLAGLMNYSGYTLTIATGHDAQASHLAAHPALARRLPLLVQRARAALRRFDPSVETRRFLSGSDYGALPDDATYPNLVKVFIDAQRDHLADRLYLVSALVTGVGGSAQIIESLDAPPDTDAERALLVAWVSRLLPQIARAADSAEAPIHVYLFDRRSQSSLLGALARHFETLCAVPAFYDLLTSHPALTQPMISFLAEEVCERMNLAHVCQNLYEVARELGFRWETDAHDHIQKKFRTRIFDGTRQFTRDTTTQLFSPTHSRSTEAQSADAKDDSTRSVESTTLHVEASARFGTEIPLEYAYAAWGALRETPQAQEQERSYISNFLGVTMDDVRSLAALRCRALRHIEESFKQKNKRVEKQPLMLSRLDEIEADPASVPFSRALEDFLYLEHHAKVQSLMLHLALPPEQRAQTGRTLLLRCDSYEKTGEGERATFSFGAESAGALGAVAKFRVGDWAVLSPLADEDGRALPAWRVLRGRLAIVEALDAVHVRLRLLPMTFKHSDFRFPHVRHKPEAGTLYTLDEMADDLNADKFLDACRNSETNNLYRWLCDTDEGKRPRAIRPRRLRDATEIAALASRAQSSRRTTHAPSPDNKTDSRSHHAETNTQLPHDGTNAQSSYEETATQSSRGLTDAQRRVVGELLTDRVVVLQGPPGTGKSHTLGYAILSRALALATPTRPFRVAVCAKTHAATQIALASVARRARELKQSVTGDAQSVTDAVRLAPLDGLKVVKVCADAGERVPVGVEKIFTDGGEDTTAVSQWDALLGEPLLVVGGTPGGLYKLVKEGAARGRAIDWAEKFFDLVVVDEASQMGIAEALTAAAFLRDDGQFIAIGDHRQMPPILAHAWDEESRRDMKRARPHLSIFEYLRALGFRSEALDESFRIPAEIADFLRRHVYAADGVNFRSANRKRLDATENLDGWLAAVFTPEHALVVVEHDESGSQQSNEFEASLVAQIARVAFHQLGLDARDGVGVVVPHRAQKSLLQARLPELAESIDTVERFQGGERDLIILSATVSDREFAQAESGFLLEPRRLTVAVSRPRRKLVVVSSRAVFDLIPADLDEYERGALWKYLRHECAATTLWEGDMDGQRVAVRALGV